MTTEETRKKAYAVCAEVIDQRYEEDDDVAAEMSKIVKALRAASLVPPTADTQEPLTSPEAIK